jgi:hydroxymethylbilane synthase
VSNTPAVSTAVTLDALPLGARVGTSAPRRRAQLLYLRPDLCLLDVRGNVDTRLRKLAAGEVDALVLARAGLERLGRLAEAGGVLDELVPAAGQGALALEARAGVSVPAILRDPSATVCVGAERALVRALEASCNTPVGAFARVVGDGSVELVAWVGRPDGSAWIRDRLTGDAEGVGARVAERLFAVGARELLS